MKIGLVGFGFIGGMHAQAYDTLPGATISAVADPDLEATRGKLARQGLSVPVFSSLTELLQQTAVDAVDICSPTDLHKCLSIEAAEAGKHLFIEKPLSLDMESCREIQAAVQSAGVHAQVGHCIRFWPEYVALKAFRDSGKGGALKSLSLQRRAARPGYSQSNWLNQEERSGGAALDLHIHDTDFVLHLLGTPRSVTSQVTAGISGPDHIFTLYDTDTVSVQSEGGWDYPAQYGFMMAFEAVFEKACLSYNSASGNGLMLTMEGETPRPVPVDPAGSRQSTLREGNISSLAGYYNELEYFVSCLASGKAPAIATLEQSAESLRVVLAEIRSGTTRERVTLR